MKKQPRPTQDELLRWRRDGKTLQQIAEDRQVSRGLVKLWVKELSAQTYERYPSGAKRIRQRRHRLPTVSGRVPRHEEGMSRMEIAKSRLGERLKERRGYYYLDDKIVTTQQLLDAAGI